MNFINSWVAKAKQWDKASLNLRIGPVTIIYVDLDISQRRFAMSLINFGVVIQGKKKEEK